MNIRFLTFLILSFSFIGPAHASLSDRLPIKLVEKLVNENLWESRYDNDNDSETQNIENFVQKIENNAYAEEIVDDLFSGKRGSRYSKTYPIKAIVLRHYIEREYSSNVIDAGELWVKRYVRFALSFAKSIGSKSIKKYAESFQSKVSSGAIEIKDLTENQRKKLSGNISSHGDFLKKGKSNNYLVTGAYSRELKVFYIDLARRSLEQTIVTFIHEMIHASDSELDHAHKVLLEESKKFFEIISKKMDEKSLRIFKSKLLSPFMYEKSIQQVHQFVTRSISKSSGKADQVYSKSEKKVIRKWFNAYIRLTVYNEYVAYGESLKFLSKISSDLNLVHGDIEHYKSLVNEFLKGDEVFIYYQGYIFSPFRKIKSSVYKLPISNSEKRASLLASQGLEEIYLDIIKQLGVSNNDYFYDLKKIKFSKSTRGADWTSDLDLPTNPYQVLTSKITTSWALRFKKNVRLINEYLKSQSSTLYGLKLGILDLHDVNQGELKLIGVYWRSSKYQAIDSSKIDELGADLDLINDEIKSYFEIYDWSPDIYDKKSNKSYIQSEQVIENLIRLKLLKFNAWLDLNIEGWKLTLLGSRVFVEKLQSGVYVNPDEINLERQKELENEFLEISKQANISSDTIKEISTLIRELKVMNTFAKELSWTKMESESLKKIDMLEKMLSSLGIYGSFDSDDAKGIVEVKASKYYTQLEPHIKKCSKTKNIVNYKATGPLNGGLFEIEGESFKLMLSCYKRELYAVRLPGDFTRYMTMSYGPNQQLASKVFRGSRKILLKPVKDPELKKKKKKGGFFSIFN